VKVLEKSLLFKTIKTITTVTNKIIPVDIPIQNPIGNALFEPSSYEFIIFVDVGIVDICVVVSVFFWYSLKSVPLKGCDVVLSLSLRYPLKSVNVSEIVVVSLFLGLLKFVTVARCVVASVVVDARCVVVSVVRDVRRVVVSVVGEVRCVVVAVVRGVRCVVVSDGLISLSLKFKHSVIRQQHIVKIRY